MEVLVCGLFCVICGGKKNFISKWIKVSNEIFTMAVKILYACGSKAKCGIEVFWIQRKVEYAVYNIIQYQGILENGGMDFVSIGCDKIEVPEWKTEHKKHYIM